LLPLTVNVALPVAVEFVTGGDSLAGLNDAV